MGLSQITENGRKTQMNPMQHHLNVIQCGQQSWNQSHTNFGQFNVFQKNNNSPNE